MSVRETLQRTGRNPEPSIDTALEKAFGPVAASLLAASVGVLVLGMLTVLAEASTSIAKALTYSSRVGPLSGKTIWAVVAFATSWIVLTVAFWKRNPSERVVFSLTGISVALGLLLTFPKFFDLFKP